MMHRRKFVGALAGGLAMSRSMAEAQPVAKIYRVGFLLGATGESDCRYFIRSRKGCANSDMLMGVTSPLCSGTPMARWNGFRILLLNLWASRWT